MLDPHAPAVCPTVEAVRSKQPTRTIMLQRQPDGTFVDWGRNVTVNGQRGEGMARWYCGEAARVMALVVKHSEKKEGNRK